jgi:RNA polymerase sigma-70 factor (ECF subfamily)
VASDDRPVDGDRRRFESLYREHYGAIMRYAARRTDEQTARDIAAETFLVAWRRLDAVPAPNALPWLYATARNVLRHEHRGGSRRARLGEQLQAQPTDIAADVADSVVNRLHYRQLLDALPDKEREAIELVEWEHLDIATAARVVGCSAATFRVRLHRARRRLSDAVTSLNLVTEEVPS